MARHDPRQALAYRALVHNPIDYFRVDRTTHVLGFDARTKDGVMDTRTIKPWPTDMARGVPICGFTGINGAGKTTLAVESALSDLRMGRKVYSTVPIVSEWGNSEPILSLRQLLELEDATILLDDVAVIFSSRSSQSLPPEVVALIQTLRHQKLTLRWTAPAWMRCDNLIREVTQGLVNVVPMLRRHEAGNVWPSPRVIAAGLLDTSTGKTDETPTKVLRRRLVLPGKLHAWGTFDTEAATPLLGRHLQGGSCVDCGGTVSREKHSAERHAHLGIPWYGDDVRAPVIGHADTPTPSNRTATDVPFIGSGNGHADAPEPTYPTFESLVKFANGD